MIVDGRKLAKRIYAELQNEVSHLTQVPHLTVFTCAPNFATKKYLRLKQRKAREVGVGVTIIELPDDLDTQQVQQSVERACMQTDGIIVQLPLPAHLDTDRILATIPPDYDVDGVHYGAGVQTLLPPVVAAIAEIAGEYDVSFTGKQVVVLGYGRLVGKPASVWAKQQGAQVTVLTKDSADTATVIKQADILILGAGQAHLVKPDMVRDGVVIFDAGTSEEGGELAGDADPACAYKASVYTPVPGGIGPLTVAMLLRNVLSCVR